MTIDEIEENLTKPGDYAGIDEKDAILRLHNAYGFIQYPRKELKQVMADLRERIVVLKCGLEKPTASDRLLLIVLQSFAGDVPEI